MERNAESKLSVEYEIRLTDELIMMRRFFSSLSSAGQFASCGASSSHGWITDLLSDGSGSSGSDCGAARGGRDGGGLLSSIIYRHPRFT